MKPNNSFSRKAQTGSNAAVTIIVVTILIVLYLLFLPPADREAVLSGAQIDGRGSTNYGEAGTSTGTLSKYLLRENVGKVYEQNKEEKTIELVASNIGTTTEGKVIKSKSTIYTKNSAFQDVKDTLEFQVDPELAANLILSFNADVAEGNLIIKLNDQQIFRKELKYKNSPPIYLDADMLSVNNVITFEVDSPGIAFWRYNEYSLTDIKITADVKDISKSQSKQSFNIESTEFENTDTARLKYIPVCKEEQIRSFIIKLNNEQVFSGIPDCNVHNFIAISKVQLESGVNKLEFSVEEGTMIVDRPELILNFKDPEYPIYYFDLDEAYFADEKDTETCGEIDGFCPSGCSEDEDKDCCIRRSLNYWCDVDTENFNDRCVSYVNDCERCAAGYEDRSGEAPDKCIDDAEAQDAYYCGDDEDGQCPAGCSKYYDKDCCYEDGPNYWCEDVPTQGLESVCEPEINNYECNDCVAGYENEDGKKPTCTNDEEITDNKETLKDKYDVKATFTFPNDDKKELDIWINGRKFGINTIQKEYSRNIDEYVKSGSNSIEIRPLTDGIITELAIKLLR